MKTVKKNKKSLFEELEAKSNLEWKIHDLLKGDKNMLEKLKRIVSAYKKKEEVKVRPVEEIANDWYKIEDNLMDIKDDLQIMLAQFDTVKEIIYDSIEDANKPYSQDEKEV